MMKEQIIDHMVYSLKFIASYRIYHAKIEINSFRFIAVRYPLQAKHLCTQSRFDLLIKMAKIEIKMNIGILIT